MTSAQGMARNLTDALDGFLVGKCYLITDRDPLFTAAFRTMLASAGVKSVRLPARSPNLTAYAERFVRSVRDQGLSEVLPLGDKHLRELLREYVAHYHLARNHKGLPNALLEPSDDNSVMAG